MELLNDPNWTPAQAAAAERVLSRVRVTPERIPEINAEIRIHVARAAGQPAAGQPAKRRRAKPAGKGRWLVLNQFIDHGRFSFTRAERDVWLTVFRKTGPSGLVKFSRRTLAELSGVQLREAVSAVRKMVDLNYLQPVHLSKVSGTPSVYRFLPEPDEGLRHDLDR